MDEEHGGWDRVGRAISDRIEELRLSKAEFIKRSGISDKTLNGYLAGKPIKRVDKERELCDALGWSTDSIQLILEGHSPIGSVKSEFEIVLRRLDAQDELLAEILAALRGGQRSR